MIFIPTVCISLNNSHFLEEAEVIKNIIILSPSGMYHNIFYRTKQESNSVPVIIIILMLMQAQEICRKSVYIPLNKLLFKIHYLFFYSYNAHYCQRLKSTPPFNK